MTFLMHCFLCCKCIFSLIFYDDISNNDDDNNKININDFSLEKVKVLKVSLNINKTLIKCSFNNKKSNSSSAYLSRFYFALNTSWRLRKRKWRTTFSLSVQRNKPPSFPLNTIDSLIQYEKSLKKTLKVK